MTAAQSSGVCPRKPPVFSVWTYLCCHPRCALTLALPIRFWVLETVARIPYFAFISMLHLYETLGWWRAAAPLRKVHSTTLVPSPRVHELYPCSALQYPPAYAMRIPA